MTTPTNNSQGAETRSLTLYEGVREVAMQDATVYTYIKMQSKAGGDDLETAIAIINQLAKEKQQYLDYAQRVKDASVTPVLIPKGLLL